MNIDRAAIIGLFGWLLMALVRLIIQGYEDVDLDGRMLASINKLILEFVPTVLLFFVLGVVLYVRLRRQSEIPIGGDVMDAFKGSLKTNNLTLIDAALVMSNKQRLETARLAAAIRKDAEIQDRSETE